MMSRELEAAIAEALGMAVVAKNLWEITLPRYSTDGNAMLELDREMRCRGYWLTNSRYFKTENGVGWWEATYWKEEKDGMLSLGRSLCEPYSRALAAYKALTGKEWRGGGE